MYENPHAGFFLNLNESRTPCSIPQALSALGFKVWRGLVLTTPITILSAPRSLKHSANKEKGSSIQNVLETLNPKVQPLSACDQESAVAPTSPASPLAEDKNSMNANTVY